MEIANNKEVMIFRKDYNGIPKYSTCISKKNKDNSYDNAYMTVKFKKDVTLRDRAKIMIKNAWQGFDKYEGKIYWYYFINDFAIIDQGEMQETQSDEVSNPFQEFGEQIAIEESELPF